ncbi:hypothetical protein GQ53DRAFT_713153 [Thozetella sp. PMI_491]|nr:hypothetical protein GQ53DRAFT_713153 [Thozetella sp. PMI_491]
MTEYTTKEIAQHDKKSDLWVVVHGKVIDVTKYVDDHPGGAEVFLELAGKDATQAFEEAGHSEDAVEIMESMAIAKKKGAVLTRPATKAPEVLVPVETTGHHKGFHITTDQAVGLTAIVVGALTAISLVRHREAAAADISKILNAAPTSHWLEWFRPNKLGFAGGFLLASGVFGALSVYGMEKLPRLVQGTDYSQLPRHLQADRSIHQRKLISVRGYLEPKTYQSLRLISKTEVAPGIYHLVFELPTPKTVLGLPVGQHVAIKADIDGQTVSRSYTPVSNNTDLGRLELVIRCYADGLFTGRYIQHLNLGDEVLFRGPRGAMRYQQGIAKKIGMVAGGTGITPMFSLIRAICEDENDMTEVSLVYGNRSETDILLRSELETFARRYPNNFKLWYQLDAVPANWAYGKGYVTQQVIQEHLPAPSPDTKMMLCGPPGMVNAAKKAMVGLGFKEPGAVARTTDQIFIF